MTAQQREQLTKALVGERSQHVNDRMWEEFSQIVREDIARIEPIIDDFLKQAADEGRQRARKTSRDLFRMFRGGSTFEVRK